MHKWSSLFSCLVALAALGCGGGGGGGASPVAAAKSAAPRGAQVFERECAGCHGAEGEGIAGTPAVMGDGALPLKGAGGDHGPFANAHDVFAYVKKEMPLPQAKAGSLSDEDYWAVTAYLLAGSGRKLPPGGLTAENAKSVVVNAP